MTSTQTVLSINRNGSFSFPLIKKADFCRKIVEFAAIKIKNLKFDVCRTVHRNIFL